MTTETHRISGYTLTFLGNEGIHIPVREDKTVHQEGIKVLRDGEFVLFVHPDLEDGTEWVVAHASGYTVGFPLAESLEEAKGIVMAALADDVIRDTLCESKEGMVENWLETEAPARLRVLSALHGQWKAQEAYAAFLATVPTVEDFIEYIHECPRELELELHEEEDDFIEWVEGLSDEEHGKILAAVAESYSEWGRDITYIGTFAQGVVEPGYTDRPMVLGDWWVRPNGDLKGSKICKLIEACGADYAFDDEWTTCDECLKAVRTTADGWGWKRSYALVGYNTVCHECLEADPTDYLEQFSGDPRTALTMDNIDLTDHGYMKVWGEFASGLYGGQMDSPEAIAKAFEERGWDDFIFSLDSVGQFDAHFSVYLRVEAQPWDDEDSVPDFRYVAEVEDPDYSWRTMLIEDDAGEVRTFATADEAGKHGTVYVWPNFEPGETHAEEDPAEAMKRGLRAASKQMAEVRSEADATGGVVYSKVHGDGTASTRVVSQDEFIAGIKS